MQVHVLPETLLLALSSNHTHIYGAFWRDTATPAFGFSSMVQVKLPGVADRPTQAAANQISPGAAEPRRILIRSAQFAPCAIWVPNGCRSMGYRVDFGRSAGRISPELAVASSG